MTGAEKLEDLIDVNRLKKLSEYMLEPLLDSFEEEDMQMALDKEVYLPELTINLAPYYMEMLLKYSEDMPKTAIEMFSIDHVLDWMTLNQKEKYRWFKCGGEKERERLKWLKWNIEGFKLFMLDDR